MSNQENKPLAERVKDIRDHAYRIGEGHVDSNVAIMLPLIDMLAELALGDRSGDPTNTVYEYDTKYDGDLNNATRNQGWEFVSLVINDIPMGVTKNIGVPNQSWPAQVTDQEMMRTTRYLLRRATDSPVAVALARAAQAETATSKAQEELRKLEDVRKGLQYKLEGSEERVKGLNDLCTERYEEIQAHEVRNRKLEGDISKIRRALGELKMKEILG